MSTIQEVYISYLVIGVTGAKVCSACGSESIINDAGECISECLDSDSYLASYKDGKGCRKCATDSGMVVNSGANGCVCRAGYVDRKGYCVDSSGKPFQSEDFNNNFGPTTGFSQTEAFSAPPIQQQQQQQNVNANANKVSQSQPSSAQSNSIVSTSTTIKYNTVNTTDSNAGKQTNANIIVTTVTPI